MKRLLTGVAVAALMAAGLPALAQSDNTDQMKKPAQSTSRNAGNAAQQSAPSDTAAQSGASTPSDNSSSSSPSTSKNHARAKHQTAHARGGRTAEDNMAEELNRQELQRLTQGGGQSQNGGQAPSNANQMPSGSSGTSGQSGASGQHQ